MPLVFCVLVDVFLRKTAEKDAVETRMESVQVGATHVTDTRLGLERNTRGRKEVGGESEKGEDSQFGEKILCSRTEPSDIMDSGVGRESGTPLPAEFDFYLPVSHTLRRTQRLNKARYEDGLNLAGTFDTSNVAE